jgi:AcrR family transcriptional regulator
MRAMKATNRRTAGTATRLRRPRDTRERIIERSILLFNRKGLRNVAIDRIASDLKISPGNLTYHFPRKQDLIRATMDVLKARMRTALEPPSSVRSPADAADYLLRIYRTFWDFRFFFNALTHLLTDPVLRREYLAFRDWALDTIVTDTEMLREHGYYQAPASPNNYHLLAENMWSYWLHWLRMQQIENPNASTPDNAALYDCALHHWSLCQPLMYPDFGRELLAVFNTLLKVDSPKNGTRASKAAKS